MKTSFARPATTAAPPQQSAPEISTQPKNPVGRPRKTVIEDTPPTDEALIVHEPPQSSLVFQPGGLAPVGSIEGDIDQSDLRLPQLKIASSIGPLSMLEPPVRPGTIVIGAGDQYIHLWAPAPSGHPDEAPVGVTILRAKKSFVGVKNARGEKYFDLESEQAPVFESKEAMQGAGASLSDIPGQLMCEPMLTCHIIVRKPENLDDEFSIFSIEAPDDNLYAQAFWYIRGSSYGDNAKKIFTERSLFLRAGSHTGEFNMEGKRITGSKNVWWIPRLTNGKKHSAEMVAFFAENA